MTNKSLKTRGKMVPRGHWKNIENHKELKNTIEKKYGWTSNKEAWYNVTQKHFKECGGDGLLRGTYNGSPLAFLCAVYPDYLWLPWKFKQTPKNYWSEPSNARFFLDWMANSLKLKDIDEFYGVTQQQYIKYCGNGLLNRFDNRQIEMLRFAYPCKDWKEWKFNMTVRGYFDNINNLRKAIKDVEEIEGINSPEGWYLQTVETVSKHLGAGLIANKYGSSLLRLLKEVYPDFKWKVYRFTKATHQYWHEIQNQKEWMEDFMKYMKYSSYEDLYYARREDFINFYGGGLIDYYEGHIRAIMKIIPQFQWDKKRFHKNRISLGETEWLDYLEVSLGTIERQFRVQGLKTSLDGAIPELMLGFCYHGVYWHGHLSQPVGMINELKGMNRDQLLEETRRNENKFRDLGFELYVIYDLDWNRGKKAVKVLQRIWKKVRQAISSNDSAQIV